jgi:hypothetical protein
MILNCPLPEILFLAHSQLIIIDQMNHVLKTISQEEDNLKSYYNEEFPLSENLVTAITEFIKK